ncbi:MAG TPA: hypothetical protein VGG69_05980, partial [Rhizomicrobium sp.]
PVWSQDLGDLQTAGTIGGLTVSGNNIYLSGTTANAALNAGGSATIANASSGGLDAFVFALADNGTSAVADHVSYVGTSGADRAGALTVGSDGTVYLAGTTTGTFAGQTRNTVGTNNMFVTAVASNGAIAWTRQYSGADGQSTGVAVAIDPQGSSVLDKLGLPRGTVSLNQSLDLAANSTLRTGDSFNIQIQGAGARTAKITIESGETFTTLANKINAELLGAGKATASYAHGGKTLQIKLNPGVTAALVPGPTDFDALARLGIAAGTLTSAAKGASSSSSTNSNTSGPQVFGLGFTGKMDISTSTGAGAARAQLLNVLSNIRNAYRTSNAPPASTNTPAQPSGPAPAYLTNQVANYTLALNMLTGGSSSTTA